MKINKQLTSSTNSKQVISLNKNIKNISINNNGTLFIQDKSKNQPNMSSTTNSILGNMISSSKVQKESSVITNNKSNIGITNNKLLTSTTLKDKPKITNVQLSSNMNTSSQIQNQNIQNFQKQESSIEKLLRYGSTTQSNMQNLSNKLQNTSTNQSQNNDMSDKLNDGKIPSLKNICKSKDKKYGTKDIKINLVGPTKIKIQSSMTNQAYAQNGNGTFTNGAQDIKHSHIQEYSGYSNQNSTPIVISHGSLIDKNPLLNSDKKDKNSIIYNKVSPKNFQYEEITDSEQLSNYPSGKLPSDLNSVQVTESDFQPSSVNSKSINLKVRQGNTFSPVNASIYDELSKKLIKQPSGNYPKIGYFSEEIEPTASVVVTEEKSSRKKPNQNILEAENPEDLHLIQVEMLLQSKQISKKFENEQEKSPKITSLKLPTLSVIPIDEVDI